MTELAAAQQAPGAQAVRLAAAGPKSEAVIAYSKIVGALFLLGSTAYALDHIVVPEYRIFIPVFMVVVIVGC